MNGPAATPAAAPAASFRTSRRVGFDRVDCDIAFPLVYAVDGPAEPAAPRHGAAARRGRLGRRSDGAGAQADRPESGSWPTILPWRQVSRQGPREPLPRTR